MTAGRQTTLPGQHYCKAHQGNHSHYDPQNCTVCVLLTALQQAEFQLARLLTHENSRAALPCLDAMRAAIAKATEG